MALGGGQYDTIVGQFYPFIPLVHPSQSDPFSENAWLGGLASDYGLGEESL